MNSFNLCLSRKLSLFQFRRTAFSGKIGRFFLSAFWISHFTDFWPPLFHGCSHYMSIYFSLAAFYTVFIFIFCHFNYKVSCCGPLWVGPVWHSLCFLYLNVCFLSQVREAFQLLCLQICSLPLSLSSPFGISIMLVCLMLPLRSLKLSSFLFILFSVKHQ